MGSIYDELAKEVRDPVKKIVRREIKKALKPIVAQVHTALAIEDKVKAEVKKQLAEQSEAA